MVPATTRIEREYFQLLFPVSNYSQNTVADDFPLISLQVICCFEIYEGKIMQRFCKQVFILRCSLTRDFPKSYETKYVKIVFILFKFLLKVFSRNMTKKHILKPYIQDERTREVHAS